MRRGIFDDHVATFNIACVAQATVKRSQSVRALFAVAKEADHRQCQLLPTRRERPCRRCASEESEIAPSHAAPPLGPEPDLTISLHEPCVVRHSKTRRPLSEMGQNGKSSLRCARRLPL